MSKRRLSVSSLTADSLSVRRKFTLGTANVFDARKTTGFTTTSNVYKWKGTWDVSKYYSAGDIVSYQGSSYVALISNTGIATSDADTWRLVAEKGSDGADGAVGPKGDKGDKGDTGATGPAGADGALGVNWRGTFSGSATYAVNDLVTYGGSTYRANAANGPSSLVPPASSSWTLLSGGLNYLGAWAGSTQYYPRDVVTYQGQTHVCKLAPTSFQGPGNGTYWDALAVKGSSITYRGAWSSATTYVANDCVNYNGTMYIANLSSNNTVPDSNPTYWSVAVQKGDTGATGATGPAGPAGATGATGPKGDKGDGVVWKGDFSASTAYSVNDAVSYSGSTYICNTAVSAGGAVPSASSSWSLFAKGYASVVRRYPPLATDPTASSGNSFTVVQDADYGSGAYVFASGVSNGSNTVLALFDRNTSTYLASFSTNFDGTTGAYTGSATIAGITAMWASIKLPRPIQPTTFVLKNLSSPASTTPKAGYVLASNDGTTWTTLYRTVTAGGTAPDFTPLAANTIDLSSVGVAYQYFAIAITHSWNTSGTNSICRINEWEIYGIPTGESLRYAGTYSSAVTYYPGQVAVYNGSMYSCKQDALNRDPSAVGSLYWDKVLDVGTRIMRFKRSVDEQFTWLDLLTFDSTPSAVVGTAFATLNDTGAGKGFLFTINETGAYQVLFTYNIGDLRNIDFWVQVNNDTSTRYMEISGPVFKGQAMDIFSLNAGDTLQIFLYCWDAIERILHRAVALVKYP